MKQLVTLEIIYVSPATNEEIKKIKKDTLDEVLKTIKKYSCYKILKIEISEVK